METEVIGRKYIRTMYMHVHAHETKGSTQIRHQKSCHERDSNPLYVASFNMHFNVQFHSGGMNPRAPPPLQVYNENLAQMKE